MLRAGPDDGRRYAIGAMTGSAQYIDELQLVRAWSNPAKAVDTSR